LTSSAAQARAQIGEVGPRFLTNIVVQLKRPLLSGFHDPLAIVSDAHS
jgi:hypothetical protein